MIGLAGVTSLAACSEEDTTRSYDAPLAPRVGPDGWALVFDDEFDGSAVDPTKWLFRAGDLGHRGTPNGGVPSLVEVRDGSLFVSAGRTAETPEFPYPYGVGYIDTRTTFAQTYGKIEFRARAPYAPGAWFAVWGRSWTNLVPELDVELLAANVTQTWFVNHWDVMPVPADDRRSFTTVNGMDIRQPHTYTIIWQPDFVEFQIDGQAFMRDTDPKRVPHEPMFWIANAWVGGWGGTPSPSTIFPATMEIEYFRIYRTGEWLVPPTARITNARDRVSVGDTIDVDIADFDLDPKVEVWDGDKRVQTLTKPPFKYQPKGVTHGVHTFKFVATDGDRRAETSLTCTIY
jgi:beta-glucanase (GH16 family)